MFEEVSYKTMIMMFIAFLVIGCMMYFMKDTLFSSKQVSFDPVVTEKTVDGDNPDSDDYFLPSKTFTGRKPGYVFTLRDEGQGYYKDKI